MKKAGCWIIGFGVESGNQEMLDKMKKGITIEQTEKAVRLCKKYKIKTYPKQANKLIEKDNRKWHLVVK